MKKYILLFALTISLQSLFAQQVEWAKNSGGAGSDYGYSVCADKAGNIYVAGLTAASDFPIVDPGGGAYVQGAMGGGINDIFIQKYNSSGSLLWSTYYGGSGQEGANSIISDSSGNIYVTGYTTSTDFPLANSGTFFASTLNGLQDAFILKFNSNGALIWSTYFGGSGGDRAFAMAPDNLGSIFLTGTASAGFPLLNPGAGAYFQSINSGTDDVFVSKFDTLGNLLWSTYYGGNGNESASGIVSDISGNIYLAGHTSSTNFPVQSLPGAYNQATKAGGSEDAFIIQFDNAGTRRWATYLGGNAEDKAFSLSIDKNNNTYLTGYTTSSNFPLLNPGGGGYYYDVILGGTDLFICKFDNSKAIAWSTFYGGAGTDVGLFVTASSSDTIWVSGYTLSTDFPILNPGGGAFYQGTKGGGTWDGFVSSFNSSGVNLWSTYFGSAGNAKGNSILASPGKTYIAGEFSDTLNFGTPLISNGGYDVLLAKLSTASISTGLFNKYLNPSGLSIYPNPSNNRVQIDYILESPSYVGLEVFNSLGQKVETLVIGEQQQGKYQYTFESKTAGIYFVKLSMDGESYSQKLILH